MNLMFQILAMIASIQESNKLHSLMEVFITNVNINKVKQILSKVYFNTNPFGGLIQKEPFRFITYKFPNNFS